MNCHKCNIYLDNTAVNCYSCNTPNIGGISYNLQETSAVVTNLASNLAELFRTELLKFSLASLNDGQKEQVQKEMNLRFLTLIKEGKLDNEIKNSMKEIKFEPNESLMTEAFSKLVDGIICGMPKVGYPNNNVYSSFWGTIEKLTTQLAENLFDKYREDIEVTVKDNIKTFDTTKIVVDLIQKKLKSILS